MATGMRVSAVVALVAAIGVAFALPPRRRPESVALARPQDAALPQPAREPASVPAGEGSAPATAVIAG